jgi:hypothetical protein
VTGSTPTPITAKSASIRRPCFGDERLEAPVALEALGAVAEDHLDAVVAMQGLDRAPDLGSHDVLQGRLEDLDHRDVQPELAKRRRHLGADEPHPDEHRLRAVLGGLRIASASGANRRSSTPGSSSPG